MKTNELSSMMLSSTVSLLKLVGTMLYSAIVTTLAWPNTLRISWANKPNIPLLTTLENSHTQSTLTTGNDFEKRTVPTRPIPNPTIVPTTSPTRTILKPRAVDIIQTNPLPLLNPTPIPIPIPIPNRIQSPPPPLKVQGELEYEISEILDSKIDRRRACKLLYLVRWLGYENTDEEYSCLPSTELEHASKLISDFHSAYPDKPGPTSRL